jgi:hypothetical protein
LERFQAVGARRGRWIKSNGSFTVPNFSSFVKNESSIVYICTEEDQKIATPLRISIKLLQWQNDGVDDV